MSDLWPAVPDCPTCHALKSTEMIRRHENGCFWMLCNCCSKVYLLDKHGQVLHRADDIRG